MSGEIDPYAILGVSRAASRAEIARAYRALARKHHPDAGAPPNPTMARINEAWHVLSDVNRRARWDRLHAMPVEPAHWARSPDVPMRRAEPAPAAPPSKMDSPWVVIGVLGVVAALVAATMIGVSIASSQPEPPRRAFTSPDLSLTHPDGWSRARGALEQPDEHRIIVHLVSYSLPSDELCTVFGDPCRPAPAEIPRNEASIVIIGYSGGTPPEPEPLTSRPYGLDADAMIGGQPAAVERRDGGAGTTLVWYQLSPPGFPDRWIEVNAVIADRSLDDSEVLGEITAMLDTIAFRGD